MLTGADVDAGLVLGRGEGVCAAAVVRVAVALACLVGFGRWLVVVWLAPWMSAACVIRALCDPVEWPAGVDGIVGVPVGEWEVPPSSR